VVFELLRRYAGVVNIQEKGCMLLAILTEESADKVGLGHCSICTALRVRSRT
jgi:hypothetical protein